ncbi:MAG: hypothetical protein QOG07_1110, partial [Pseudonocardiales bacterium]|nr:hypothetical protein [Pseudonocardiales bacterium]
TDGPLAFGYIDPGSSLPYARSRAVQPFVHLAQCDGPS